MIIKLAIISLVASIAALAAVGTNYGFAVFVILPLSVGAVTDLVLRPETAGQTMVVSSVPGIIIGLSLLALNAEGLGCLIMVMPLALPMFWLGAVLAFFFRRASPRHRDAALLAVALLSPTTLAAEAIWPWEVPVFSVTSSIEVDAPPEAVWKHVVSFSELPEDRDWLFHTGIAYPMRAEISGTGPGAIRRCVFSTGPFVEPIQVWDEPRLLRFSVTENPAPMEEWTPYGSLDAPHLHGYLVSKQGQFHLTPLPGGRTLLEGTTWYQHRLEPAGYWKLWTDFIIHRIHLRVLRHVKALAERDVPA